MDNIKGVGGYQPPIHKTPAESQMPAEEEVSFEQMLQETQTVTYTPEMGKESPLSKIPTNLIPMQETKRDLVGYQTTFLGTFSKKAVANLSRTENKIAVNSPLGNMKLEQSSQNPALIYVEMPQGNFMGNIVVKENGDIYIESENKKKAILIHPEENGDLRVTNRGIQENIKLVFKGLS